MPPIAAIDGSACRGFMSPEARRYSSASLRAVVSLCTASGALFGGTLVSPGKLFFLDDSKKTHEREKAEGHTRRPSVASESTDTSNEDRILVVHHNVVLFVL